MKGGFKIIRTIGLLILPFLLYVHQYVLLFQASYHINEKQHQLSQKTEQYRRLKFEVDRLRAPRLLEDYMRKLNLDLSLPKEVNVVKIPGSVPERIPIEVHEVTPDNWQGRLFGWVGRWVEVAQAKVDEGPSTS